LRRIGLFDIQKKGYINHFEEWLLKK